MSKRLLLFVLGILSVCSIAYSQNGTRSIGYNARSNGRGGVDIGFFDNAGSMLTNPAGLSFIKKSQLMINGKFMLPTPHYKNFTKDASGNTTTNVLNDINGETNPYVLPSLAYVHNFKDSKLTLAAGVFTTGGMGADFSLKNQLFVNPPQSANYIEQIYKSRFAVIESGISAAYLITKQLSVGVTGEFVYSTLEFINPFTLPPSVLQGTAMPGMTFGQMFSAPRTMGGLGYSELTSAAEMSALSSYSFGGRIGLAYKFSDIFSLGLSYNLPVNLNYKDGNAKLDMSYQFADANLRAVQNVMMRYPGITQGQAQDTVTNMFTAMGINPLAGFTATYNVNNEFKMPQSVGFGFGYAPKPYLRFGFDFEWLNWSKAFDKMKMTLKNGNNSNINRMIGSGGTGQPELVVDFPLDWKDAIILKFGCEADISKVVTLRAGYAYGTNPIPKETIIPIIPAVLEHHISGGASFIITPQFNMSVAFEYGLPYTLTASTPHKLGSEYNNSESSLKNLIGHLGFVYLF